MTPDDITETQADAAREAAEQPYWDALMAEEPDD